MPLTFRRRVFLGLVALGTLPLAAALAVLAWQATTRASPAGPRSALDEIARSARDLSQIVDTTRLSEPERLAIRRHEATIAERTTLARRAETLSRSAAGAVTILIAVLGLLAVLVSIRLASRWSRYVSAPIDELISWTRLIERGRPLPDRSAYDVGPEFAALGAALHDMADALVTARLREIERERLVAFREVARSVAHEVRGPVTASRLALAQISNAAHRGLRLPEDALAVLEEESNRLENMAREFAEFGRLPEGPVASIDIGEMLQSVVTATVPEAVPVHLSVPNDITFVGRYEALRRAVQNILRNAVDVADGRGIEVSVKAVNTPTSRVQISIADHGPGIPSGDRDRVFEPYFTTKRQGTGLGLALVRQTVESHGGVISAQTTPGGGATFVIDLPQSAK
jgi:two-component system, NtrC family, nitrogen regulation sensor histidine kinase NtrY